MRTTLLLEIAADAGCDRIAIGGLANGLTGAMLRDRAKTVASWVQGQGEAQQLAFIGLNGETVPLLLFAAGYAGIPFVPINYRLPDADLNRLVARTSPSVLVIDDDMIPRLDAVAGVTVIPRSQLENEIATGPVPEDFVEGEGEIAVLLFTSGTTGEPKAAVLRHENLTSYVMGTTEFLGCDEDEAALVSVPPYHIAGISAILTSIYSGRRIVYLPAFTPESWAEMAAAERISQAMVVPTMLDRILDILEQKDEHLPALRALSYGGGRMPEPVIARALKALPHVDFVNAYGLTETSSTIALLGADDHRIAIASDDPEIRQRLCSVGKPLPTIELEIRDEQGQCVPAGTSGEIHVRGDQVSGEYLGKQGLCAQGWFATNDAGWLDRDGYLYVEGRLDDVIVRGGENISPGEIEDVLRTHPGVADVAVLGLPDDQWGEKIAAVIVARDGAADAANLSDYVRSRLRSTKTPECWHFRDELPYNETGKLLRRVLKSELSEPATIG
ncbi:MAG: AMP-binding protein [Blastomonas sp.]